MSIKQILPGLFQIPLGPVNAFLIAHDDDLVLIDTGNPGDEFAIDAAIHSVGHAIENVNHVVVTHCHPDHAGSLAALQRRTQFTTYMHPLDAKLVRAGIALRPTTAPGPGIFNKLLFRRYVKPVMNDPIEAARVDREVEEQTELPIAGGLEIVHGPGHSLGQILVLWKQHGGVLFVADAAVNVGYLAAAPAYEDWEVGRQTLKRIGSGVFQVACFGHGKPILKNASRRFQRRWGNRRRK